MANVTYDNQSNEDVYDRSSRKAQRRCAFREYVGYTAGTPDKANNDDVWRVLQRAMIGSVRINDVGFRVPA